MFFDGIKPKEYSLNEEKFPTNNYANILSFIISENNKLNDSLLLDIYPLMEEAILFDDDLMLLESVSDELALSISSLKKIVARIEDLWNKFYSDYSSTKYDANSLISKALSNKSISGYSYLGYNYHIRYENIYVDHSLVNSGSLIARQLNKDRVDQLKRYYDSPQYYDKIRGSFISKPTCSADDFSRELKKYYRCGQESPIEIHVNENTIEKIVKSITGTDETIETCKAIKNSISTYAKTALSYLEEMHKLTKVDKTKMLDSRVINYKLSDIEELASVQVKNIRMMLSIYAIVLATKIDICNERQKTYIKVLEDLNEGGEN